MIAESTHVRLDLFAVKPVENNLDWFDDVANHAQSAWGSYLTVPASIVSRGQADFYSSDWTRSQSHTTEVPPTSFDIPSEPECFAQ